MTDTRLLLLSPQDNIYVLRGAIEAGETVALEDGSAAVPGRLGLGHKIARGAIAPGEKVVKYGAAIGSATEPIPAGAHVHIHNLQSDYTPTYALTGASEDVSQ